MEQHTIQLPDGRIIDDWSWLITPDYTNTVAVMPDGRILCFRQTKYAISGTGIGIPGGFLEPGEAPLAGAQRELREETGYEATEWTPLGAYPVDANRGAGVAHFYVARGLRRVAEPTADDLEEHELLPLTLSEVQAALAAGEFKALAWAAAISLALLHLGMLTGCGWLDGVTRSPCK